ncbi:MAG: hypothetical protein SFY92_05390 [Verrucomicrobiae bacterium]|nr:hypothetical protein [Verrucomicrobiae bacterium]
MKHIPSIVGALLGLLFIVFGLVVLLRLVAMPPLPEGTPAALFMGAFAPTGYLTFVKVLEVFGGILLMIPFTRNFGLLIIGPIIVNILAFHVFIMGGATLADPVLIVICLMGAYLLWDARKKFLGLLGTRTEKI